MQRLLTQEKLDVWRGFRFIVEETSLGVSRSLFSLTGVSGGQFGILTALLESPSHVMRQQELADAMRWDRTRLSHQLTRMARHGWIKREMGEKRATLVSLMEAGHQARNRAASMLGPILEESFFSRLTPTQLATLKEIQAALDIEIQPKKQKTSRTLVRRFKTA